MENANSKFEFLETEDSQLHFAECDFALRSGKHIQKAPHEETEFDYLDNYYKELEYYYFSLFGIRLRIEEVPERYYYLDFDSDTNSRISKSKGEKLSSKYTLLGLLLLKMYRIDRFFDSNRISKQQFKESLKDENDDYKDEVYRLFAKVSQKADATMVDEDSIDTWIDNSLHKFKDLGWIIFDTDERDIFEIMPSINRLFKMYESEILNIDKILEEESEETNTGTQE